MLDLAVLGDKIDRIAKLRGFKQYELADKTGVSDTFMNLVVKGKKKPGLDTLQRIADALEIPIAALVNNKQLDDEQLGLFIDTYRIICGKGGPEYQALKSTAALTRKK